MKARFLSYLALGLTTVLVGSAVMADKSEKADESAKKQQETPHVATVGQPAPEFTLTSAGGEKISLADYSGKFVVLEWINFDCPFVVAQYKSGNMQGLQKTYTGKDVVWLSVCSSAPGKQGFFEGETLQGRIQQAGWNGTAYLIDADGKVGKMYEAKTTPHMYVVNPEGILVYAGAIDSQPTTEVAAIAKSTNYVSAALEAGMSGKEVAMKTSMPYGCGVKYK